MPINAARALLVAIAAAMLSLAADAQSIPKEKGAARDFALFHFYCLQHLPDLQGIERAAGLGEYDQLSGDDLAPYVPDTPYEKLLGWRYHDRGQEFILTAVRNKPDDAFKKEMPTWAGSKRVACALRMPNEKPDLLLGELTRAIARAPDKSWQDGATRVYSWAHQTSDALSYVQFYVPENAGTKAVLEASAYLKK